MLMADTVAIVFVVVGFMVSTVGLWLLARGLWPERVALARERFDRGLLISLVVGLPITVVALLAAAVVSNLPGKAGGVGAAAIVCGYVAFASVGVSGLATTIGSRLGSAVDATSPWRATLRGGIVLVASFLVPVLGWFGILPIAMVAGSGAAALALVPRRAKAPIGAAVPIVAPQS